MYSSVLHHLVSFECLWCFLVGEDQCDGGRFGGGMGIEGVGKLGMGVVEGGVQGRWLGVSVDGS